MTKPFAKSLEGKAEKWAKSIPPGYVEPGKLEDSITVWQARAWLAGYRAGKKTKKILVFMCSDCPKKHIKKTEHAQIWLAGYKEGRLGLKAAASKHSDSGQEMHAEQKPLGNSGAVLHSMTAPARPKKEVRK